MSHLPISFTNTHLLITGASSGIGRATAILLSKLGARLALLARNETRLQETCDLLAGEGHEIYPFDLRQSDEIAPLLKRITANGNELHGLFHAAGIAQIRSIGLVKETFLRDIFASSLDSGLLLTRGFCQKGVASPNGGSIVLMSSVAAHSGQAGMSVYAASKAAIEGAVRALACELAPRHIRVNAIAAGFVLTSMYDELTKNLTDESIQAYAQRYLLGFGEADDVAYAAAFLLSQASKWITGTAMIVDGGYLCH